MNCLIIDDNKIARTTLKQLASQVKDLTVAGECSNAMEAWNLLQEQPVDLLLLDIEMQGMSGLELTRNLGTKRPVIVFTTSKKDYAAEAFELNVADYIVKPVTPPRFIQAIDRVREILDSSKEEVKFTEDEFIFIRDSNIVRRLSLQDILYAEAMGDYVKLYTPGKFYAIHTTLKAVEERLPPGKFLRVHRSYIVAISKIETIQDGALIINGKPIPVADAYRSALNKRMNIL
ncbi:DNA-binding response regulator [Paraflavitalea soli]|uniref:DNA-binding response regulator n=1 Tax=Paraflavitalea soli TaxID=2315862 RepID=A0A3B7MWX7_9BACT|nr:LytTR family DNA-binding domain-containing protein [Paraflavitalea soli]AXY77973.1 DNA-binding response regulator [Paraflavitalea soli]